MQPNIQQAIGLASQGRTEEAASIFREVVKQTADVENAWLWLAHVTSDRAERVYALEQALRCNPSNGQTAQMLVQLRQELAQPAAADGESTPSMFSEHREPLVAGGLSLLSSALILIGFFILPWFYCNLAGFVSGQFTGFHALLQFIGATLTSLVAAFSSDSNSTAEAGFLIFFLLLIATVIIADIPYSGYRIGRLGLRYIQTLDMPAEEKRKISKRLKRAAISGFIPTFIYLSFAIVGIDYSGGYLSSDIVLTITGKGLWLTLLGFGMAFATVVLISTSASWSEQIKRKRSEVQDEKRRDQAGRQV